MHDQSYPQAPVQHPGAYPSAPAPAGAPQPKRRTGLLLAISAVVAFVIIGGGLALVGPFRSTATIDADAAALRSAPSSTTAGQVPADVEVPTTPIDVGDLPVAVDDGPVTSNGPSPSGNTGGAPTPRPQAPSGPSAPAAPAPVITSFTTPENIDCHNGDFQTFSASWTTTNATKTMISIDGPGGYKTYAANDSDSLPFSCSSPHTFLLTAYGHDGSTVTRSITLQPRNVQVPDNGQDDDAEPSGNPAPAPSSDDEI